MNLLSKHNPTAQPAAATIAAPHSAAPGADAKRVRELPIPLAALECVAARLREGGLMLALALPDGTVAFHDPDAVPLFARFALPLLRQHLASAAAAAGRPAAQPSPDDVIRLPGLVAGAWPWVERKQTVGTLLLVGRDETFELDEDTLRASGRLRLDGGWLLAQARHLPAHTAATLAAQGRLLPGMLRDQVRLEGMEREQDSLSNQLANSYEELSLIYQISSGMKVNRRAPDFFRQACVEVLEVMGVRAMGFGLKDELLQQAAGPELCGDHALSPEQVECLADDLMAALANHDGALLVHDLAADARFGWLAGHARQLLAVPLQRQEQLLGCLFALDKGAGEFDSVDSKLLNSIANESAIYLENARLFEDVHGLMMGLLHSLTSAVDAKDAYTCGHSERVALISRHLAQASGLGDRDVEQIYMAGLLHDVGKIGVPEAVLQKAGRLTPEEFEQIKRHPAIGARILQDVKQIQGIIPGVLHHHERYDGKGYPSGLSGEAIPLMGRIICLADCFDAMTSSRTYRKGLPLEVAMAEIRRCAGTQFDPRLAEVFLRFGPEKLRELLREHQQKSVRLRDLQELLRT